MPFAVILGEDEQAQGKVKIKQMGLPDGHPEKDGIPVDLTDLVPEIRNRLAAKAERDRERDRQIELIVNESNKLLSQSVELS